MTRSRFGRAVVALRWPIAVAWIAAAALATAALPSIEEVIDLTIRLGSRTNPAIRCGGVSLNTSAYDADAAEALMAAERQRLGLPVTDPIRGGASFDALVENILS